MEPVVHVSRTFDPNRRSCTSRNGHQSFSGSARKRSTRWAVSSGRVTATGCRPPSITASVAGGIRRAIRRPYLQIDMFCCPSRRQRPPGLLSCRTHPAGSRHAGQTRKPDDRPTWPTVESVHQSTSLPRRAARSRLGGTRILDLGLRRPDKATATLALLVSQTKQAHLGRAYAGRTCASKPQSSLAV
jgi:hypothetical protein